MKLWVCQIEGHLAGFCSSNVKMMAKAPRLYDETSNVPFEG